MRSTPSSLLKSRSRRASTPAEATKRRAPQTPRGEQTRERLLRTAERAFGRYGYHRASVAHICRLSRVANGTFYQYFSDKEEIFVALVKHLMQQLHTAVESRRAESHGAISCILRIVRAFLHFLQDHRRLYQVFREAEFVRLDLSQAFYQRLAERFRGIVQRGIQRGELRTCDPETVAYCLVGLQEFLALRYVIWSDSLTKSVFEAAEALIRGGIDSGCPMRATSDSSPGAGVNEKIVPQNGHRLIGGEETRSRLLQAAEAEFGVKGFHRASVADIARDAGVAPGTVYIYFRSKQELFAELIHEINQGLRRASARAFAGLQDRRAIERAGFSAFFEFIEQHRRAYGIVREAEFVDGRAGRWYYLRLGAPYARELARAMKRTELARMPAEPLAFALMGIGHFVGLRWLIWPGFSSNGTGSSSASQLPEHVFEEVMRFILQGISKSARRPPG